MPFGFRGFPGGFEGFEGFGGFRVLGGFWGVRDLPSFPPFSRGRQVRLPNVKPIQRLRHTGAPQDKRPTTLYDTILDYTNYTDTTILLN